MVNKNILKMTEFKIEPREHRIRVYLSVLLIFVVCAFGLAVCLMQYPKPFKKGKDYLMEYVVEIQGDSYIWVPLYLSRHTPTCTLVIQV